MNAALAADGFYTRQTRQGRGAALWKPFCCVCDTTDFLSAPSETLHWDDTLAGSARLWGRLQRFCTLTALDTLLLGHLKTAARRAAKTGLPSVGRAGSERMAIMLHIAIPAILGDGKDAPRELALEHLVCDVNGTLAADGLLIEGVVGRLTELARSLRIHLLTADTYGTVGVIVEQLRMAAVAADVAPPQWARVHSGEQKAKIVRELGAASVVAVGNGANDVAMFALARLSVAVLGEEGVSGRAVQAATVLARSINDALDLLLFPQRLVATLRP